MEKKKIFSKSWKPFQSFLKTILEFNKKISLEILGKKKKFFSQFFIFENLEEKKSVTNFLISKSDFSHISSSSQTSILSFFKLKFFFESSREQNLPHGDLKKEFHWGTNVQEEKSIKINLKRQKNNFGFLAKGVEFDPNLSCSKLI